MPLTPETLPRHELVGLPVRVAAASNPDLVGIAGRVARETTRTLSVSDGSRARQVPKRGTTFEFRLPDDSEQADAGGSALGERSGREVPANSDTEERAGDESPARTDEAAGDRKDPGAAFEPADGPGEDAVHVTVDGERLLSRPARRTETTGDSLWR